MSRTTERAVQVHGDLARRLTGFPHIGAGMVVDAAMNAPKQVVIGQRQAELDRARPPYDPTALPRRELLSCRSIQRQPRHEGVGALDLDAAKTPLVDPGEQ